ncbi:MAG: hypothetical protein Q9M76_02700 [Candidatus Dojkabacteria bacterium]|nr:hypothetical protein [Candidatus Dojkabacteria bacterium]
MSHITLSRFITDSNDVNKLNELIDRVSKSIEYIEISPKSINFGLLQLNKKDIIYNSISSKPLTR